ncbi:uncharacterized protein LOC141597258 [Silene latifolia]|uniref:uncharacterized protein LOC141597258 n=1 Tax=Silene latifolia TaxID=37657 RepID=UPI003D76C4AA
MATQTPLVIDEETMETLSVATLPQLLACKHSETGHFLAVVTDDGPLKDHLEFNPDIDQFSRRAQFVVEMAENNQDVHLKSCYNGKYWVRESDDESAFITATAVETVNDMDAWNNTLFRPFPSVGSDGTKFSLVKRFVSPVGESIHQNGDAGRQYLRTSAPGGPYVYLLAVECTTPVVTLPKFVSFKGDNGKFLEVSGVESGRYAYNVFKGDNRGETRAMYEIVPVDNRFVRIKSYDYDRFLRRIDNDLIQSYSQDDSGDDALFEVLKTPESASTINIRNVGNNMFCVRAPSSSNDRPDYLIANGTDADAKEAQFEVVERVITRQIVVNPTDFRMADAILYDHESFEMDRRSVGNTYTVPTQWHMTFTFTKSRISSWDNTETIKQDGSIVVRSSIPQIIGENEVVLRDAYQGLYSRGQPIHESEKITVHHEVLVPPKGSIFATLVAKKSTCKVPFSYVETDLSTTRPYKTYNKDDGVYIGTHVYDYEIIEKTTPYTAVNDAE